MYIDTSVLVAYYFPEKQSKKAQSLIQSANAPMISWLTETEFSSAIAKKVRTKTLSAPSAHLLLEKFRQHLDENYFQVLPIRHKHFLSARSQLSSLDTSLSTLDALHLALAYEEKQMLATSDHILAKNALALGVKVKLLK